MALIRVTAYRGLEHVKIIGQTQGGGHGVYLLAQPYEWSEVVEVGDKPVLVPPVANPNVQFVVIEVPGQYVLRYEVLTPGRKVWAGWRSPRAVSFERISFKDGWGLSLVNLDDQEVPDGAGK